MDPSEVYQGGKTTASWRAFSGEVNIYLYKGGVPVATVDQNRPGNDDQELDMKGRYDEIRNDWRIKVELVSDPSVYAWSRYFKVKKPQSPDLGSPSDKSIFNNAVGETNSITFRWTSNSDSKDYQLKIYRSDNESDTKFYNSVGNVIGYTYNGIKNWKSNFYKWKVRVRVVNNIDYWSDWSSPSEILVDKPPTNGPDISSPSNKNCIKSNNNQNFSWNWSGPTIDRYNLRIVKGNNLNNTPTYNSELTPNKINLKLSSSKFSAGNYIWGIRVIKKVERTGYDQSEYENTIGWGAYSTRYFTMSPPTPSGLNLKIIVGGFKISWTDVYGASGNPAYKIFWGTSDDVDENSEVIEEDVSPSNHTGLEVGQTYYYRIQSCYDDCCSELSETVSKKYELPKPELISPSQNQTWNQAKIEFEWKDVGADKYELYVDNNSGLGSPEVSPNIKNGFDEITSNKIDLGANWIQPNQTYYWKVYAIFQDGSKSESDKGTFTYSPPTYSNPNWIPFYRTFNKNDIDHFYCSNESQLEIAKESNYVFEGKEGYISSRPMNSNLACIYRFYIDDKRDNPNVKLRRHYFTTSATQRDNLLANGTGNSEEKVIYEGIAGYTYSDPVKGMVPMYQSYLNQTDKRDIFYTLSEAEYKQSHELFNYSLQGIKFYVSQYGDYLPQISSLGINLFDGTLSHYSTPSFNIKGAKTNLSFTHIYNTRSLVDQNRSLGYGWSHNYSAYLIEVENSSNLKMVLVQWQGGNGNLYAAYNFNQYQICKSPGVYDRLIKLSSTEYRVKKKDHTVYKFNKLSSEDKKFYLKEITDRNGNTIILTYDDYNRLDRVTSPGNRYLKFKYFQPQGETLGEDKRKLIKEVIEYSLGYERKISFTYDVNYNLTSFKDLRGNVTNYSYNKDYPNDHILQEVTLPEGNKITNTFPSKYGDKKIQKQIIQRNTGEETVYNINYPSTQHARVQINNNKPSDYYFNPKGLVKKIGLPSGRNVEYKYEDSDHPALPSKIIDGKNNETIIEYDGNGNTTKISKPLNIIHQMNYNSKNDLEDYINPRGKKYDFNYDSEGNLKEIITPRNAKTRLYYNDDGTVKEIYDPLNKKTSFTYNSYGNVKTVNVHGNSVLTTTYSYDGASRVTQIKNPKNQITKYYYKVNDLFDKVITYNNNIEHVVDYTYDKNNNLIEVIDPKKNSTRMKYNGKNQVKSVTNQISEQTEIEYFDFSGIKEITKPDGNSINYNYDEDFRLSNISFPDYNAFISYDKNDNITLISDDNGKINFTDYDAIDRLKSYTDFYGNTVTYKYDKNSNITEIGYPNGKYVKYTYYADDLLYEVKWNGTKTIATYHYRDDGSVEKIEYGNGTYVTFDYDDAGRLTGLANKKSNGKVINSYDYTLDDLGNHTKVTKNEPLPILPFHSSTTSYDYNDANRIQYAGDENYSFDKNGNMTGRSGGKKNYTYTFDDLDRLTKVTGNNYNASYVYDIVGDRRAKTLNGTTTRYVLDINSSMSNVLIETDGNNNPKNYYIHGIGLVARVKPNGNIHYYHKDSRGSVIAMTDENENITHKYAYTEFGKVSNVVEPENDRNPFRYVGGYGVMDEGNGLYFMRARYYDVENGRFISEDPQWNVNLYSYVTSNPIIAIDPLGLSKLSSPQQIKYMQEDALYYEQMAIYAEAEVEIIEYFDQMLETVSQVALPKGDALYSFIGFVVASYEGDKELAKEKFQDFLSSVSFTTEIATDLYNISKGVLENDIKMIVDSAIDLAFDITTKRISDDISQRKKIILDGTKKAFNIGKDWLMKLW